MLKLNRILIIRTDRIGDVVLTLPVLKALRKAYPMAHISMLVSPLTVALVDGNPYLDEILVDEIKTAHSGPIGLLKLARLIRSRQFDAVFIFYTKNRYNLVCYLAGVPMRIGYKNEKMGFLLTHPLKDGREQGHKHEAQYCLDVLTYIGIESQDFDAFIPADREAEQWARQWMQEQGLGQQEVIAIHAGSSDPAKCWAEENFAGLIESLQQRYAFKIILIGGSETVDRSAKIKTLLKQKPLDLTGQTSLSQTISFLRRCHMLISNDSGPVHIASALGIHVISLFMRDEPGINPQRWKPFSDKGHFLFSSDGIKVQDVLQLTEGIFRKDHQRSFPW
jgi:heptosyltransferase-2